MEERLRKQLEFALEIDKEKNILRQTHLSGHGRRENDAEHAWHMAIMAYLLREYANEEVDIAKVMLMCLIHDIVEIDAGDTYAYDEENLKTQKAILALLGAVLFIKIITDPLLLTAFIAAVTAWFMYWLQGDTAAGKAFIGSQAELLTNNRWQDVSLRHLNQIK